jgi:hypothetical protein
MANMNKTVKQVVDDLAQLKGLTYLSSALDPMIKALEKAIAGVPAKDIPLSQAPAVAAAADALDTAVEGMVYDASRISMVVAPARPAYTGC